MGEKQIAVPNDHLKACALAIGQDRFGFVKVADDYVEGFNRFFGVRIYRVGETGSYLPEALELATLSGAAVKTLRAHKFGCVVFEGAMATYDSEGLVIVMGSSYPVNTDKFFSNVEEPSGEGCVYVNPLILEKIGQACRVAFGTRDFGAKSIKSNDFFRCSVGLRCWREGKLVRVSVDYKGLYRLEGVVAAMRE